MAYKTVANLRDSVQGMLQGLNLNNVTNINGAFERAARILGTKIDIPEVEGRQSVTLYDGVYDYAPNTDIFGGSVVDFRQQGVSRGVNDYVYRKTIEEFDRTKAYLPNGTEITFEYVNGVPRMRIVSVIPTPRIELDTCSLTTGWTLSGSASGLTQDSTVFYQQPSSLRFLLTGASTGILTKTISQVDLTSYVGVGVVFIAIRTPSATNLTSLSVKLGSTAGLASDYYTASATTGFLGSFTVGDWQLIAINLANATTTGTPVPTAIKYIQISIAHAATLTNFYIGDFWIALPTPCTLIYKSVALFMATGGTPLQTISANTDTINLSDPAYTLYEHESAISVAKQQGGSMAEGIVADLSLELNGIPGRRLGLYDIYRSENPSGVLKTVGSYYD